MSRQLEFSIGEYYHIYNRGADKRETFLSENDYRRFITLLYLSNSTEPLNIKIERKTFEELFEEERNNVLVDIGAYCLMPNHFHILLKEKVENGISKFMQKLNTSYTMYFNKKNDRSGVLFQGVFKAEHANRDEYLEYLFSYIHLNPVKLIEPKWKEDGIKNPSKARSFLDNYRYSSYIEYKGVKRLENKILNKEAFPVYFDEIDIDKTIRFWLEFKNKLNPQ